MQTIPVCASRSYDILIGQNILPELCRHAGGIAPGQRVAIVTDDNVAPLHLETLTRLLENAGIRYATYILPHGESSKDLVHLGEILEFLAGEGLTRSDRLVALGGGVVGDITGLCAALYLRGVDFIQIPTTLLACVDSSVGGKCAVDLCAGKNLAGAFHQPTLVLCDTALLSTLPEEEFACGMAEVIKYGIGFDEAVFKLCEGDVKTDLETVIAACVSIKRDVVAADEFDRGERKKLNLGHTPAHAIEALSDFAIPHGKAVGMGLSLMVHAALPEEAGRVDFVLEKNGLIPDVPYGAKELAAAALSDKKREGDTISLIVPTGIGRCEIRETAVNRLEEIFLGGLK